MRRGSLRLTIPNPTGARSIPGSFGESCATPVTRLDVLQFLIDMEPDFMKG